MHDLATAEIRETWRGEGLFIFIMGIISILGLIKWVPDS